MPDIMQLEQSGRTLKPLSLRRSTSAVLSEWLERLIESQVPVGFEDETGFYRSMQPARSLRDDVNQ
ncbi:MAG TPA: hypothetical protein VMA13_03535 [Candidatus Saccharimonadales bacterium]|nr:hypothetical protein [Candidatus Saccharimonadales bacterium]